MKPACEPLIAVRDIELANAALSSDWVSSAGIYLASFEERWADYCNMPHSIALSNVFSTRKPV